MASTNSDSPIINRPYHPPEWHWQRASDGRIVDAPKQPNRYPATGRLPNIPGFHLRNKISSMGDMTQMQAHLEMVNDIRGEISVWQTRGFPNVTNVTRDLLGHWTDPERNGLYFAQKEAILTAIWLTEVAPETETGSAILQEIETINLFINSGVPRVCHQMATGTGKTAVMAAIILWQTFNHVRYPNDDRFTNQFLAIGPGITVKDRLESGLQHLRDGQLNLSTEYLNPQLNIVPTAYEGDLRHIRFRAVNYHQFIPRDASGNIPKTVKTFVGMNSQTESELQVIERVLGQSKSPVVIFNDEAHHCHHGDPRMKSEEQSDTDDAHVWFNAVDALQRHGLIHSRVYDLSATPSFIAANATPLFPWIVSQYALQEAEEAGIVKIMRLPNDGNRPNNWDDELARNIYAKTKDGKVITREDDDSDNRDLKAALKMMYLNWDDKRNDENWTQRSIPPVLAVIVNAVASANRIFDYIAGWEREETLYPGKLGNELSNVNIEGTGYHEFPRTILVHSKLDSPEDEGTDEAARYLKRQAAVYRTLYPNALSNFNVPFHQAPDKDIIRTVLNTVGKPGNPGEHVRCIVSIGMLTEGWDARTVTHIVGYRQFGTQLICEQVSGRALRRVAFDADEDGFFYPEYADILGIPFTNLSSGRGENPNPNPIPPYYEVRTLDDRENLKICWPHIIAYRRSAAKNGLLIKGPGDWHSVKGLEVPDQNRAERILTTPGAPAGESNPLYEQPITQQEFHYLMAKNIVDSLTEIDHEDVVVRRGSVFQRACQLIQDACSNGKLKGPINEGRWPNRHTIEPRNAARWLMEYIEVIGEGNKQADVTAVTGDPRWLNSGRLTPYTSNRSHKYETTKSEVNVAVCESGWEVRLAAILDYHPEITKWIRNERLGWTIPYKFDGIPRQYEPDFVAVAMIEDGREVKIVIEVKGLERPTDPEKRRWTQEYWIPSVNQDPEFSKGGPWIYLYLDTEPTPAHTGYLISEAIAQVSVA